MLAGPGGQYTRPRPQPCTTTNLPTNNKLLDNQTIKNNLNLHKVHSIRTFENFLSHGLNQPWP